jgi:hypothetical protein
MEFNGEKIKFLDKVETSLDVKFGITESGTIVWIRGDEVHCVYVRNHHSNVLAYITSQ